MTREWQTVHLFTPYKYLQHLTSIVVVLIWRPGVSCLWFFCSYVLIGVWIKMVCVFEYNVCVWVNFLCVNKKFCKKLCLFWFHYPRIYRINTTENISSFSSLYPSYFNLVFFLSHLLPHTHSFHSHPCTPLTLKNCSHVTPI